jgi:Flp pilus assembly protein CpaB
MLSTRQGTIVAAVTCALIAAGVLAFAIGRYRASVNASTKPTTAFVAKSLIQKGTSGDTIASTSVAAPTSVLQNQVSAGAVADISALRGKVATRDILPGQQLTAVDFTSSGALNTQLAPNERAISVPLDTSHGLTSVLHSGDRVDVYAGLNSSVNGSGGGGSASVATRLLLTNVPVMQVNLNSGGGVGGGGVGQQANVLLKVHASDAGAMAFAADNGKVWLVLRGANATTPKAQNGVVFTFNRVLHGLTGGTP